MFSTSFRSLSSPHSPFPTPGRKLLTVSLALVVAGCGGSKGAGDAQQPVAGGGYRFSAPAGWTVTRAARGMSASSPAGDGELVSVTVFRLARRYRPSLWPEVLPELDRVARMLADELHGTTGAGRTETVAGRRVRAYDIEYERSGSAFVERIVFVLEGRREYQLLCRFPAGRPVQGERSCAAFARSFGLE